MITISPSRARAAIKRFFAMYRLISDHLPDIGGRSEGEPIRRYASRDSAGSLEQNLNQFRIFGEKQNVPHQDVNGLLAREWFDLVLRTFGKQIQRLKRRRYVLSGYAQIAGERRAKCSVDSIHGADIRDFVREENDIGGRQARERGLAGAGYPGERESASVAHGAGGVQQAAPFGRQQNRVEDAQDRIDRLMKSPLLPYPPAAGVGKPLGPEIKTLE